ncbi:pentapeptide repeat-containing protein [Burkholderia cepacia]|uniref:pentapeptide repeat-containing protein n=1 Tax=Burkholderia cepacia TaxID=292 RepID=UPI0009BEDD27|nr:pentapeptide repeat-containing protein [Burkholderia cepacia]
MTILILIVGAVVLYALYTKAKAQRSGPKPVEAPKAAPVEVLTPAFEDETVGDKSSDVKIFNVEIKNCNDSVICTAVVECPENTYPSRRFGMAVKWAYDNKVDLRGANLKDGDLQGLHLAGIELSNADLRWTMFDRANVRGANFSCADMRECGLNATDCSHADFTRADLRGAYMSETKFMLANLAGADLRGTHAEYLDKRGANLDNALFDHHY